jgi:hypothetical protein
MKSAVALFKQNNELLVSRLMGCRGEVTSPSAWVGHAFRVRYASSRRGLIATYLFPQP